MADTQLTSLTLVGSGGIGNVNSTFLYGVIGGNSRQFSFDTLAQRVGKMNFATVTRTNVQSIPSGAWTAIIWNTEETDLPGAFGTNTIFLTVPSSYSWVRLSAFTQWFAIDSGFRVTRIMQNSLNTIIRGDAAGADSYNGTFIQTRILPVTSGDRYHVAVFQNTGANLNFQGDQVNAGLPYFMMELWP